MTEQQVTEEQSAEAQSDGAYEQRPELYVGAALAGGFLLALLLKRLGPND